MKVSVFTPTDGRPETLELCKQYVRYQTYSIHEHVIEEGGTLAENLRNGLPKCTGDLIVIFEDDDFYHPDWVNWCVTEVECGAKVVGEQATRFYHVPTGGYAVVGTGTQRSSLCNTAFTKDLVPDLLAVVKENHIPIDLDFWGRCVDKGYPMSTNIGTGLTCDNGCKKEVCAEAREDGHYYVVGIKGLPGKKGMSFGHQPGYYNRFHHDNGPRQVLQEWVSPYLAEAYLKLAGVPVP